MSEPTREQQLEAAWTTAMTGEGAECLAQESEMTTKRATKQYRQGDVLLMEAAPAAESEPLPRDGDRIVLAYGETTGHAHAISAPPSVAALFGAGAGLDRHLRLTSHSLLEHDEHDAIWVPAGDYIVRRQREYRRGELRTVKD